MEDVQKQMRAVKKKLSAIAELDEKVKVDSAYLLSAEQKDKMSKRKELFAEYAHLEQLLVRCQVRERAGGKAQPEDRSNVSAEEAHSTTTTTTAQAVFPLPTPATAASVTTGGSITLIEQLSVHEASRASPAPKSDPVPQVKYAKKGKVKGISLQEFNTILESSSTTASSGNGKNTNTTGGKAPGDFAAWGRSLEASKVTTSTPASATLSAGSSVWGAKSAPVAVVLSEANAAPPVPPPVFPAVSTESPLKKAPISTSDTAVGAPRRTRALLDFLPAATASAKGLTPVTPPAGKGGWSAASPGASSTAKAVTPTKAAAFSPSHPVTPIRFSDIQRTEETARQTSTIATLQGNSRPWFVERHQRAASIEEVVRQQALDRAEEEEIARVVAEIDRVSLLTAKAQAAKLTAKGGKAEKNKSNKKKKPSIAGGAAMKK